MRIVRATLAALTAFLATTVVLGVLGLFVVVAYTGEGVLRSLLYCALPVVIMATTMAVLHAQRSLTNSDWRQAVMAVPEYKVRFITDPEFTGLLPASHWSMPDPSPQEEQLEGMKAQLGYWSSEPVQAWSGPSAEDSGGAAPLPKRRVADDAPRVAENDGEATEKGTTTLVLPAPVEESSLAAAVAEVLRNAGPMTWKPAESSTD